MKRVFSVLLLILAMPGVHAQYTVNGSASANACRCYTLTQAQDFQSGSVWNNIKIDLSQPFNFTFDINLGCNDAGADGIVFVLQPISTSVGGSGGGLGFENITPSVGVTIDTWQNEAVNDPIYDHIAIQLNGNIDHSNAANIAGPVTVLADNPDVEDCIWHTLRIQWEPVSKKLSVWVDGQPRVDATKDLINDVFGGNPQVFWGFTGSTGGARNLQQFCTSLSPLYKSIKEQKRCINSPISFIDSSHSFAPIVKMYWDFGDGSPIDSVSKNPVHTYTAAGDYTLLQTVIGADGCIEVNTQIVRIGGKPIPAFTYTDSCVAKEVVFNDASFAPFGTVNNWYWDFDNGTTGTASSVSTSYLNGGDKNIRLFVSTEEGCISDTVEATIHIFQRSQLDFSFTDSVCVGASVNFSGVIVSSVDPVQSIGWNFGDSGTDFMQINTNHTFQTGGDKSVSFFASTTPDNGCLAIINKPVFIRSKPVAVFKNDFVCQSVSSTLLDSSYTTDNTVITQWHWDLGNGQTSSLQNPQVSFNVVDTIDIKLSVRAGGCISDTITKPLIIAATPGADFDYTGKLCEGMLLQFSDSSKVQSSTIVKWSWFYQNAEWSNEQNPSKTFAAGGQNVGLLVESGKGCKSAIAVKNFSITPRPLFSVDFTDGCKDAVLPFSATDLSGNILGWQWSFGDGAAAFSKDTLHSYNTGGSYNVVLSVIASNGCEAVDSSVITIYATDADAGVNTVIAAAEQPIQLNVTGGITYTWSPKEGLNDSTIANPVATNSEDQLYIVKASTPQGCDSYDSVLIKIYDGPEIYVPSAFNPGSTVGNHILKPIPVGITRFKYFTVYNRYGQVVFTSTDPAAGWDGTLKGTPQAMGTFVWIVAGTSFRGREIIKKGTVVLLR